MITVAALFVDEKPGGAYVDLPGVEVWGVTRDARKYDGPYPVIAHPPCQLWTNFAALNYKRWGGEHNRPGNDGDCFLNALSSVRAFGGVLEHPAFSNAWNRFGLPRPPPTGWGWIAGTKKEFVCEVWQSAYGHKARKRTWLYYWGNWPEDLDWSRPNGESQIGWFDRIKPTLSKKEASATPLAFRDALLKLARNSA